MPEPLIPARLAFAGDGTPWSESFGDLYHSAEGGPGQARHVFLAGNGLPGRWAGRGRFVVLETGFGLGLNFLATWQAWRDDPRRCARLHFVSIEKHPFARSDLAAAHARYAELAPLAEALHVRWPMLVPGCHRLAFDDERVVLTLYFGDIAAALTGLRLAADAVYLDGFAPERNAEMWSVDALRRVARLCAPGASAATWSVAAPVRKALQAARFEIETRPGFGRKRQMLTARFAPLRAAPAAPPAPERREAVVIGAGLAGAAVCERLALRGWGVTLVERHAAPAQEASGNHAGTFHPVVTPDDSVLARLTRAGFLAALANWSALESAGAALRWDRCGVLQLARNDSEAAAQRAALAALGLPPEYAQFVTREEASAHAGAGVAAGGLWFPESGWMRPASAVRAQLERCGDALTARYGREATALERIDSAWQVRDAQGATIAEAPVVVLANAADALRLAPSRHLRLRSVRGQLSYLPADRIEAPHAVVLRSGMVLPPIEGRCVVGASYDFDDDDPELRAESHAGNLERLAGILPGAAPALDPGALDGRVAFRTVSGDRLPLGGALADERAALDRADEVARARLRFVPRMPGVYGAFAYGSRGLVWAALVAELVASEIEGEPLPLEGGLAEAIDPARFLMRALRRALHARV